MDDKRSKLFNAHQSYFGSQWLNVVPCKNLGLKLEDQHVRISIGLRLGGNICVARGRDISSPAIWATKISAHFGYKNVAQMSHQICSHTPSALMQERSEAERRAMWPCLIVAIWRRERSDRALQQIC